ncbi:hypothetical protein HI145_RS01200 [Escherichia coli]|nr:hypothetical protein [Escherichia coli]
MPIRGVPEPLMEVIKHVRIGDREVNLRRGNIYYFKTSEMSSVQIVIGTSIMITRVLDGSTDFVGYNVLTNKVTHTYKWSGYKTIKYEFDLARTEEERFMLSTINPANYPDLDAFLLILKLYNEANQKAKDYDRIMYERRKERAQKSYDLYDSPYVKYSKGSK